MKNLMIGLSVATTMAVSVAHAGFLDNALKIAQAVQSGNPNAALNQAANLAAQQTTQQKQVQAVVNATPYTTAQLGAMDCAALAVSAANANREVKNLQGQADSFDKLADQADQEAAAAGNTKMIGGLLSLAGGIMGNEGNSSAETLSTLGKNLSTTQSEAALQGVDSNAIVAQYKKHQADLENIKIYQSAKKCSF